MGSAAAPERLSGKTVAVVGSGPAGLAAAQQLARAGHRGRLRTRRPDRRSAALRHPRVQDGEEPSDPAVGADGGRGVKFRTGIEIGTDLSADDLRRRYDAVLLAVGSTIGRDLPVPGRELTGVYQAMDYLPLANRVQEGDLEEGADPPPASTW